MLWDKLVEKSEELLEHLVNNPEKELSDERLRELSEKMQQPGYARQKLKEQQGFDYYPAFRQIADRQRRFQMRRAMRIAASIGLPLCLGVTAYFFLADPLEPLQPSQTAMTVVKPGGNKAILEMANGQIVELAGQQGEIREINGTAIRMDSAGIRYAHRTEKADEQELENRIRIPRGGEFRLVLSDGTRVWLNADSELKYPVTFGKDKREVSISGEAYFEVSRDTVRPFIVRAKAGKVCVLGTEFNVRAYREEKQLVATLVQGKVACSLPQGEKTVILQADEQVVIDKNGIGPIRKVNPRLYVGWKDGLFVFENERLEEILIQLSRWYDIEVSYTDMHLKDLHFSGDLSRFKDIEVFLKMFENSADIAFSLKGKTLTVSRR